MKAKNIFHKGFTGGFKKTAKRSCSKLRRRMGKAAAQQACEDRKRPYR